MAIISILVLVWYNKILAAMKVMDKPLIVRCSRSGFNALLLTISEGQIERITNCR